MLNIKLIPHPAARWVIYAGLALYAVIQFIPYMQARDPMNGFKTQGASIPPGAIEQGGPPRDGIPALTRPDFRAVDEVDYLQPHDRILALSLNRQARAYPIKILNWHEVINDHFGSQAVVISYCPLCGSGMVFEATVRGRALDFGVSGLLYNSDVLLYDRQTDSLWSQLLGQAISGPMKDTKLRQLSAEYTSWQDWKQQHPEGQVLDINTGHQRDYALDPYADYRSSDGLYFRVDHRDERYHAKQAVVGLVLDGRTRVWPLNELEQHDDWPLRDQLGSTQLWVHYRAENQSVTITDAQDKPLPTIPAYWFAWVAFYPDSEVFVARPVAAEP